MVTTADWILWTGTSWGAWRTSRLMALMLSVSKVAFCKYCPVTGGPESRQIRTVASAALCRPNVGSAWGCTKLDTPLNEAAGCPWRLKVDSEPATCMGRVKQARFTRLSGRIWWRNCLPLAAVEPWFLGRPVRFVVTKLSYPGFVGEVDDLEICCFEPEYNFCCLMMYAAVAPHLHSISGTVT